VNETQFDNSKPVIALIGYRASGKTTVGRLAAGLLGGAFVDTDQVVMQQAGRSIAEIFEAEGEAGFRRRERVAIERVTRDPPKVIAVGGGAIEDQANVKTLKRVATIIRLIAPPEVLWRRIQIDAASSSLRPPLTAGVGLEQVREVLQRREPFYQAAADITIDTSSRSPIAVAREIVKWSGLQRRDDDVPA